MSGTTYYIIVQGERITVTHEVYTEYHREREHSRYIENRAKWRELSLEYFEEIGAYPYEIGVPHQLEDIFIEQEMMERLYDALSRLSKMEQQILYEIYFECKSEREIAKSLGITQMGVNKRKARALSKLKKQIKL